VEAVTDFSERAVLHVLHNPLGRDWSIQGFGMLRTYLDTEQAHRLHIWDAARANEEVSTIHDHPWDFTSRLYSGTLTNVRFIEDETAQLYQGARIRCGVGGGLVDDGPAELHGLREEADGLYLPGDTYSMEAPELHESLPSAGAVTVISRTFKGDRDHARVFWATGDWVTAEPRKATPAEVLAFTKLALSRWHS
jgi:hypothetical protein